MLKFNLTIAGYLFLVIGVGLTHFREYPLGILMLGLGLLAFVFSIMDYFEGKQ